MSGKNLNWFWNDWYFTNGYIDLAVASVTKTGGGYAVAIDNIGGCVAPVDLALHYADGTTQTVHQTPAIWKANTERHGHDPDAQDTLVARHRLHGHLDGRGHDEQPLDSAMIAAVMAPLF